MNTALDTKRFNIGRSKSGVGIECLQCDILADAYTAQCPESPSAHRGGLRETRGDRENETRLKIPMSRRI
ncbi:hypothetical protein PM082_009441 [Marasmius tenuissimus]|nr:hypothetical protein PM082_009441 [Marasmius tenuissimus]